jgi:hypothetical protein
LIDFTASQAQPSAEHPCPLRETILVDADQGSRVVCHNGHASLDNRAAVTFIREVRGSTAQQAGNDAFDHRSAVPTRVGELHLGRGPDILQARLVQDSGDVFWRGRRGQRLNRLGDPHRENSPPTKGST